MHFLLEVLPKGEGKGKAVPSMNIFSETVAYFDSVVYNLHSDLEFAVGLDRPAALSFLDTPEAGPNR